MGLIDRILTGLRRVGEEFTVNGNTYRGVFKLLDSGTMNVYLDDVEKMAVVHPGLLLTTQPDAVIAISDTITRDGRTYTVLKVAQTRVGGVAVTKQVILA